MFLSQASDLETSVADGNGTSNDLFAFDVTSGLVSTVNLASNALPTDRFGVHQEFDVSADGQIIVFVRSASDLTLVEGTANVDLNVALDHSPGKTAATITFAAGALVDSATGTLLDGNHKLVIDATEVTYNGLQLDGDADGTAGGNYIFGADAVDKFFRVCERVHVSGQVLQAKAVSLATSGCPDARCERS